VLIRESVLLGRKYDQKRLLVAARDLLLAAEAANPSPDQRERLISLRAEIDDRL